MAHLTLLCVAATASARTGAFGAPDEPLEQPFEGAGRRRIAGVDLRGPAPACVAIASSEAARATAAASGLEATIEPQIDDRRWGAWQGMSIDDLHAADPAALIRWLSDPALATPGGERFDEVVERVGNWATERAAAGGRTLAVTHPMTIRAALAATIGIGADAAMRIDIAPLSVAELSFNRGWRLQELRRG